LNDTEQREVLVHDGRGYLRVRTDLIREETLDVYLNDRKVAAIAFSGRHAEELAVGYLRSEGLLEDREELSSLETAPEGREVRIRLSAGKAAQEGSSLPEGLSVASSGARGLLVPATRKRPPLPHTISCSPEKIEFFMEDFLRRARLHDTTGGTHAAALADAGEILVVREDIGRHNAIDMLAGYALLHGIDCSGGMVFRTGRVSAEIVGKLWNMGIQLFASLSVPTSEAVRLASDAGMTLVGSVRGGRMKIYTHVERVTG
jgi:FdhD protein